jgi:penicillin amidase
VIGEHDWPGYWPVERYPSSRNPDQGYLASANQQPIDPAVDDTYLGVNWPSPWRAMRINSLLRSDSLVSPETMQEYQTDPGSARADLFVPVFLRAAERVLERGGDDRLEEAARLLAQWDRRYTRENQRAVLFEAAMRELVDRTWDELETSPGNRVATPADAVLARLLESPESLWWDVVETDAGVERRDDVLAVSLRSALDRTVAEHGPLADGGWRWDQVRQTNVYHLLGFPALSALNLPVRGGPGTLNPSSGSGTHGASWRMVVELAPEVRAWSTYPGGQSGNPASRWYDDRIGLWIEGELEPVLFPRTPDDVPAQDVAGTLLLHPGGGR